eukprot:gene17226-35602_t
MLVINNNLVAAAQRVPAHVKGDGVHSIEQLIEMENRDPRRGYGHENVLTEIDVDRDTLDLLAKMNYTVETVPTKGEIVYLKSTANLSTGGTSIDVTDMVHPENIFLAERISRVIGLDICGIDIMADNLTQPLKENGGVVLEVNAAPGFRMHLAPSEGLPRNVASPVIDMLYPPGKPCRIPIIAVTGTNGKTTVTSLTAQLVQRAGKRVAVAGNIGPTLLDTLSSHLDAGTFPEVWVLELSSFQLDGVTGFEPTAAVVLNVTQDHLDWHGSMPAYAEAKSRIFGQQGLMVLNRDDAAVMAMLPEPVRVKLQRPQERAHVTFGSDMPQRPGDFGLEEVNGMVWLVRALEADETRRKRKEEAEELHFQRLMPADALRIRGRHNASNALAALALCAAAGCALGPILFGLREYRGEPHRVEPIGILNDVEFFDDSKGTNVGATVAALQGLGADRKLVVIL